jgi:hypothetical protein
MGSRDGEQSPLWIVTADLPQSLGHPFYARLNGVLDAHDFGRFVDKRGRGSGAGAWGNRKSHRCRSTSGNAVCQRNRPIIEW